MHLLYELSVHRAFKPICFINRAQVGMLQENENGHCNQEQRRGQTAVQSLGKCIPLPSGKESEWKRNSLGSKGEGLKEVKKQMK
jgi:hypothetical protein